MKLAEMSNMDLAYIEGFIEKCAAHKVDPELFLEALMRKSAQVEVQKPMPGGSDTGPAQSPAKDPSTYVPSNKGIGRKVSKVITLPKLGAAEEDGPDYEGRRRKTIVGLGAGLGAIPGGMAGAAAGGRHPGTGALVGAGVGAGLGGGAAMIYNAIRNSLGFSAMGMPVTEQKK